MPGMQPSTQQLTDLFRQNGFVVAPGLFDAEEVEQIRSVFTAQADAGPVDGLNEVPDDAKPDDPLARFPRMLWPNRFPDLPVGPLAQRYMLDRRLQELLTAFLDGDEPLAAQSMFYFKPPGSRGQDLHQDNFYLRVSPGTCIAAWIAMDDCDQENGGLSVVPGTQHMDVVCPEESDLSQSFVNHRVKPPQGLKPQMVELKAGDVLFFGGSVIHGSGPNRSADRFRRSLIFHYVPASSAEVAKHDLPLIGFDGREIWIQEAVGGGPCGSEEATISH